MLSNKEEIIYNGDRGVAFHKTIHSLLKRANIITDNFVDEESMKIVRRALCPRPGHQLLELDYSKLEVCIAACYHKVQFQKTAR